jgi:hypothetical protein
MSPGMPKSTPLKQAGISDTLFKKLLTLKGIIKMFKMSQYYFNPIGLKYIKHIGNHHF